MKKHIFRSLQIGILTVGMTAAILAVAQDAQQEEHSSSNRLHNVPMVCSNKTLIGTYLFAAQGFTNTPTTLIADPYTGFLSYDGTGNIKYKKTWLNPASGLWETSLIEGTYFINPDCTGYANYPTNKFIYHVAPAGDSLTFIKTHTRSSTDHEFVISPHKVVAEVKRVSYSISDFSISYPIE